MIKRLLPWLMLAAMTGCATQTPPMKPVEPHVSEADQRAAQEAVLAAQQPDHLQLRRKLAVGRLSNETNYGRSLLSTHAQDELGNKVTDMFLQALTNSQRYLVFERPDIKALQRDAALTDQPLQLTGVDTLVIGSLTQFGRSTTGERGFFSSSKKQEATATVDLRLVDTTTGRIFASVTGSGSSSTEHARSFGFGSAAGYDGSLNDQAIAAAVTSAVDKMNHILLEKPWTADVLGQEAGSLFISGGASQGVETGMQFDLETRGRKVKSPTTGAYISLPGKKVGELEVVSLFGQDPIDQGAVTRLVKGSIQGYELKDLLVKEHVQ